MAYAQPSPALPRPTHPMAKTGYGKRAVGDESPHADADFAHLCPRDAEFQALEAVTAVVHGNVRAPPCAMVQRVTVLDYIRNMAEKVKFSVSLDVELGTALRQYAAAEDEQISAVISRALEQYLDNRRVIREGLRAMDEYFDEHGWPTPEEQAEAQAWVDNLFGAEHREQRSA